MQKRVFSRIAIKSLDDDLRELVGIASTPSTDRMGDIVEPDGAEFSLPIPLLWQHDHAAPIGEVYAAKVVGKKIEIKARLVSPIDGMPMAMTARLQEAWTSIKTGLVRGLSIGFSPLEYSHLDNGGVRFTKWNWHELSAVTIPANAEASISMIKSLSQDQQAATGTDADLTKPAFGLKSVALINPNKGTNTMNYLEMIQRLEATLAEKGSARNEIQKAVSDDGRTKDAAEREAFDTLNSEIKSLELELKDLRDLEAQNRATAKPVTEKAADMPASQYSGIVIKKADEKLEPGVEFARFAMCLGSARGDLHTAKSIAEKRFPQMERMNAVIKAAADVGTTTGTDFASKLVDYQDMSSDFVDFLRPKTIVGQFGQNGVPGLRSIPFNVSIKGQTAGSTAGWVGEGKHKPVTSGKYNSVNLSWAKLAAISVATDELLRFSTPSAERLIRDDLAAAVINEMDEAFIKIGNAGVSAVKPASITYEFNGTATTIPTGTANAEADIAGLWSIADTNNLDAMSAVYITTPAVARKLSGLMNAVDNPRFPGVTPFGGTYQGVPVIVSNHVDANAFILVFASEIWLADDGVVTLDASREASIIMDTDPQGRVDGIDNETSFAPVPVSMYQTNSVAFRAERYINWQTRRANVVNAVSAASWA